MAQLLSHSSLRKLEVKVVVRVLFPLLGKRGRRRAREDGKKFEVDVKKQKQKLEMAQGAGDF